ncbi:DMT family transporter [Celerinatantimonas sp. YJH-8]|uniref:DMT family transporter n=1 Tax=Celerinatantimonas sp. YJH-8 TaxID=3228714 RepID=UPI0038C9FB42
MRKYLYLVTIGLLWGTQFVFMRQAVTEIPDTWVAMGRALAGAMTLWLLCRLLRLKGNAHFWPVYALIALVDATIPFLLLAWAQKQVDSSVSAVIMGMIPLLTLLFAPLVIGEALTLIALFSVILGFAGIFVLFAPQLTGVTGDLSWLPLVLILISAGCYAMGMLLVKRFGCEHPLLVARNVLTASALQLMVVTLFGAPVIPEAVSTQSLLALLMLGIFSTGLGYFVFMMLIRLSGPTFASMSNYLVPVIGFLLGSWLLSERPPHSALWALVLILGAVGLNQWGKGRKSSSAKSVASRS